MNTGIPQPQKLRRIVTCQGGIQLIAALAALGSREREQTTPVRKYEYEDYLVIYDLYAPPGQLADFAAVVKKMATALGGWRDVVYITREQMQEMALAVDSSPPATIFAHVRELVGVSQADEIYLCRNWQFGNRLMINVYRDAKKICYGDSIGLYFSEAYFLPTAVTDRKEPKSLRERLGGFRISLREKIAGQKSKTILEEINFDIGYFLLPDILGERPPMPIKLVSVQFTRDVFSKITLSLASEHAFSIPKSIAAGPAVVLMTSNFSEAARMSRKNELHAYREFVEGLNLPNEATLFIKPHPRDEEQKIVELGRCLEHQFASVVSLSDPTLFFVPFEILLMQAFAGDVTAAAKNLTIITFSTACLSLEALFGLTPIVGFGSDVVRRYFYQSYVAGREQHEYDLHRALERLATAA